MHRWCRDQVLLMQELRRSPQGFRQGISPMPLQPAQQMLLQRPLSLQLPLRLPPHLPLTPLHAPQLPSPQQQRRQMLQQPAIPLLPQLWSPQAVLQPQQRPRPQIALLDHQMQLSAARQPPRAPAAVTHPAIRRATRLLPHPATRPVTRPSTHRATHQATQSAAAPQVSLGASGCPWNTNGL